MMTYRGIVSNGVIVLESDKLADGTVVEVTPVGIDFWQFQHWRNCVLTKRRADRGRACDLWNLAR